MSFCCHYVLTPELPVTDDTEILIDRSWSTFELKFLKTQLEFTVDLSNQHYQKHCTLDVSHTFWNSAVSNFLWIYKNLQFTNRSVSRASRVRSAEPKFPAKPPRITFPVIVRSIDARLSGPSEPEGHRKSRRLVSRWQLISRKWFMPTWLLTG